MTFYGPHGVEELISTDDALDTHRWRPHAPDRHDQGIIRQGQGIDHGDALALLQECAGVELHRIGIASTTGAQYIGANLDRFQVIRRYVPCDIHPTASTFPRRILSGGAPVSPPTLHDQLWNAPTLSPVMSQGS